MRRHLGSRCSITLNTARIAAIICSSVYCKSLREAETAEDILSQDATVQALFRTTRELSEQDRQQLLRFAQFLRQASRASKSSEDTSDRTE